MNNSPTAELAATANSDLDDKEFRIAVWRNSVNYKKTQKDSSVILGGKYMNKHNEILTKEIEIIKNNQTEILEQEIEWKDYNKEHV